MPREGNGTDWAVGIDWAVEGEGVIKFLTVRNFGFGRCYGGEAGGRSSFQGLNLPLFACACGFVSLGSNSGAPGGTQEMIGMAFQGRCP